MIGMRYAVVIERAGSNYSAYSPDVPGVVAVGDTVDECRADMREAIAVYLRQLAKNGQPAPQPSVIVEHIEL
jgi:predicted RNase H-like HicB family nuclease